MIGQWFVNQQKNDNTASTNRKVCFESSFVSDKFMTTLNKQDVSLKWACQITNRLVCKQAKKSFEHSNVSLAIHSSWYCATLI